MAQFLTSGVVPVPGGGGWGGWVALDVLSLLPGGGWGGWVEAAEDTMIAMLLSK